MARVISPTNDAGYMAVNRINPGLTQRGTVESGGDTSTELEEQLESVVANSDLGGLEQQSAIAGTAGRHPSVRSRENVLRFPWEKSNWQP